MTNAHRNIAFLAAFAALTLSASPAAAQAKHETQSQLKAEAKISMAAAKKTALAAVPKGRIKSSELERENGKLIYSFDIATKGKPGIDEVHIDAITGAQVGGVEHESPAAERKEGKKKG